MEFEHETTYVAASAVKTPDASIVRNSGGDAANVDALIKRQVEAKVELADAIDSADFEKVRALRSEIKSVPEQIQIATVKELKERLQQIEFEQDENAETIKLINAVRKQKHIEYVEKVKALEPYQQAIAEWDWKLSLAGNDGEMLRLEAREKKAKLFALSEAMRNEKD